MKESGERKAISERSMNSRRILLLKGWSLSMFKY
jgi:hypothetical protein